MDDEKARERASRLLALLERESTPEHEWSAAAVSLARTVLGCESMRRRLLGERQETRRLVVAAPSHPDIVDQVRGPTQLDSGGWQWVVTGKGRFCTPCYRRSETRHAYSIIPPGTLAARSEDGRYQHEGCHRMNGG